ncbi:MAG: VWA domain-containing protein [Calditrichaeota bacterium]|nr:MAG: VWA domain-containing protein [Calditrichota bacterium]
MFEFLFKYSRIVFEDGQLSARNLPEYAPLIGLIFLISLFLILFGYRKTQAPLPGFLKSTLLVLRYMVIILLFFIIIEPIITLTTIVPKKSAVLLLVDSSKSMQIKDERTTTRTEKIINFLAGDQASFLEKLRQDFNVLTYEFGDKIVHLDSIPDLHNNGEITNIAQALSFASSRLKSQPISAVILVTDGGHVLFDHVSKGGDTDPIKLASLLGKQKVPVFTVGVGSEIESDVRLVSVAAKSSVTGADETNLTAYIQKKGAENTNATVQIWEEDFLVKSEKLALSKNYTQYKTTIETPEKGFHNYTAKIIPEYSELVTENNSESFLINNAEKTGRVLYIEELHPWEFKFLKRALDRDRLIHFTSMVKTGKDYYRQGIRSPRELEQGFPQKKAELFQYDAIIIGSIHSSAFTKTQLNLIRNFVSIRGGGLLLLGGPKAFSQGDWQNTVIADILPVTLFDDEMAQLKSRQAIYRTPFKLALTAEGFRSPVLEFSTDAKENKKQWESLPTLLGFQLVGKAKSGATILATHPDSRDKKDHIIIASQQYGRGRTMVMATSSFWRWQMQLPSADLRHEQFWRQITRWITLSTPVPINVEPEKESYSLNENVKLFVTVLDSHFQAIQDAQISLQIKQPGNGFDRNKSRGDPPVGESITVKTTTDIQKPGRYIAEFKPEKPGIYYAETLAHSKSGQYLGHSESAFIAKEVNREFLNPALQESYLKRISKLSNGMYYSIEQAADLPDKIAVTESVYSKVVDRELWDAPIFFLLLLIFLTTEWSIRRAKGLS